MPAEKNPYKMPRPSIGACVWYPTKQGGLDPVPAIITQVGNNSVNLTVWPPDNRGGLPRDGVRHISDPSVEKQPGYDSGVWDYTDDVKRLNAIEAQVAELMTAFGSTPV